MQFRSLSRLVAPTLGVCALFCFQFACAFPVNDPSDQEAEEKDHSDVKLECTITTETKMRRVGEPPEIQVKIKNDGEETIKLVGSLDASDCKWRYPYCYFEIEGPDGYKPPTIGRCGNMNSLRTKDFVDVEAGESFDPFKSIDDYGFFACFQLSQQTFTIPGEYKLTFVYSTNGKEFADWQGDLNPQTVEEVKALWRQVPKLELKSNTITFVVSE